MTFGTGIRKIAVAVLALVLVLLIGPAQAHAVELINIQFQSTGQWNPNAPAYSGAAVIGSAGDQWNHITDGSGTNFSLSNSTGSVSSTGATMSWASTGLFGGYNATPPHTGGDDSNAFGGGTYDALMNSYLYLTADQAPKTISFKSLAASTSYDLYVYTEGDNMSAGRNLSININNNTIRTDHASLSNIGTFVQGENYIKFTGVTDGSGDLSFTYQGIGSETVNGKAGEANINGIQLRQPSGSVPEPSTYVLMGIGGLLVVLRLKRYSCA